jgi:hypothetical protein
MAKHSKLSASSSDRWLKCHGSLFLDANAVIKENSVAADIGTMIHLISEDCILHKSGSDKHLGKSFPVGDNSYEFTKEHSTLADFYIDYVLSVIGNKGNKLPFVLEKRLNYDKWAFGGFGTADCIVHDKVNKIVHIIDLKTGRIEVNAKHNSQLMLYALGARDEYNINNDYSYNLTIVQPRLNKIDTHTISTDELLEFGEYVLKQSDDITSGSKKRVMGEHCKFCPNNPTCPELNKQVLGMFDAMPDQNIENMIKVYNIADVIKTYLDKVETYLYEKALSGMELDGLKLVSSRTKRAWADNAEQRLIEVLGESAYINKLISITDAKSLIDNALLDELTIKPEGKLELVSSDDKRPAVSIVVFENLKGE